MLKSKALLFLVLTITSTTGLTAENLAYLQQEWARITYQITGDEKSVALDRLSTAATGLVAAHPNDASLLIWQGIILSSYAGEAGGFTALGAAKRARKALQHAIDLDPAALEGSAYTSLGALYYKVPGWPIGFGDDRKARSNLEQALSINPLGIDPNYFMAEFLFEKGEIAGAKAHLQIALNAPDRKGRPIADSGRRREIQALLDRIHESS